MEKRKIFVSTKIRTPDHSAGGTVSIQYYPLTKAWMGPRAGLVNLEKKNFFSLQGLEPQLATRWVGWLVGWSVGLLFRRLVSGLAGRLVRLVGGWLG